MFLSFLLEPMSVMASMKDELRAALRGEYLDTTATLSLELGAFAQEADELDVLLERDFAEAVREKARKMGKPVPMREQHELY